MSILVKSTWVVLLFVLIWDHSVGTQPVRKSPQTGVKRWWGRSCSSNLPNDGHHYANKWDGYFAFQCPTLGTSISSVYSVYRSCKRDRVWSFGCSYNKAARKNCHWSPYVNDWDKPVHYKCPNNGFITGVQSHHDNGKEDRRFKFRCCNNNQYVHYRCETTHDINHWQKTMDYKVPQNGKRFYITGAYSVHMNSKEDRVWRFDICKLRYIRKPGRGGK